MMMREKRKSSYAADKRRCKKQAIGKKMKNNKRNLNSREKKIAKEKESQRQTNKRDTKGHIPKTFHL